jgi:hypothetical protein
MVVFFWEMRTRRALPFALRTRATRAERNAARKPLQAIFSAGGSSEGVFLTGSPPFFGLGEHMANLIASAGAARDLQRLRSLTTASG